MLSLRALAKTCILRPLGGGRSDVDQIDAAITACGHYGTTVFEAGVYNITRKMKWDLVHSRIDLYGTLDFHFDFEYWMDPAHTYRAIFIQSQASWFVLTGHDFTLDAHGAGALAGNGQRWWSWYGNGTRLDGDGRPVALTLSHAARAVVRGLRVDAPPFWCHAVADSRDVRYERMRCNATNADETYFGQNIVWNTDGIDTFRSDNITLVDWDVTTGDDCLAIKGNSTNISARNITCRGGTGIALGSLGQYYDLPDYVENVVLEDITNQQVQPLMEHGVYFKSWSGTRIGFPPTGGGAGRGKVSGVVARNVRLHGVSTPVQLYQTNLGHPGDAPSRLQFANLSFERWSGTAQDTTIVDLECSAAAPCDGVAFAAMDVVPADGAPPAFRCVNVARVSGLPVGSGECSC
ncbi:pectin lyase-like protein [Trametes elegans]|nr:pectin lyase-like protein [Trametes elegans]